MFWTWQRWATIACAVGVCASTSAPFANAQQNDPTAFPERDEARYIFEEGKRAFEAHDYVLAAQAFEQAYRTAPHHAPLWNAARSWERAGEWARAANAYAKYLRVSPADAPDRNAATAALEALGAKLGRIEIHAPGIEIVRVDDVVVEEPSVYVHPGMHVIEGKTGDETIRRTENVEIGAIRSVALMADEKKEKTSEPRPTPPVVVAETANRRLALNRISSPAGNRTVNWFGPVALVAGGMTVVSAGLLTWSGLDTLEAREKFDMQPTADKLSAGKDKQLRTNLLVGATVTSGLTTGAFFSLWRRQESTMHSELSIVPPVMGSPMRVVLRGKF